jgi:putative ABC transport system substrate-binding protein
MDRRMAFAILVGLALAATSLSARCQAPPAVRRIGILALGNPVISKDWLDAFHDELAKHGWIEGRNVVTTFLYADGDTSRLPELAARLVAQQPDVMVTAFLAPVIALQRLTRTIPIVMTATDPVAAGLVKSLAHPGGNVTGSAYLGYEPNLKVLEVLKEWIPQLTRVAVILTAEEPENRLGRDTFRRGAAALGVRVDTLVIPNRAEVESRLVELERHRPDAVLLASDALGVTEGPEICARLTRLGLLSASLGPISGCVIGYSGPADLYPRQQAWYVDQILRGASPADLPVRQPTQVGLTIERPRRSG